MYHYQYTHYFMLVQFSGKHNKVSIVIFAIVKEP